MLTKALTATATFLCTTGLAVAQPARVGPSFACPRPAPADGLAQAICNNLDMSREELSFEQPYYALRYLYGKPGWKALKTQAVGFDTSLRQTCHFPAAGALDQTMPDSAAAVSCYLSETKRDCAIWLDLLHGAAQEEASRPVEQQIALQQKLVDLGFLPAGTQADGILGEASRSAISTWQRVSQRPDANGFISNADAAALLAPRSATPPAGASSAPGPLQTAPAAQSASAPTGSLADAIGSAAATPQLTPTQPFRSDVAASPTPLAPAATSPSMSVIEFLAQGNALVGKSASVNGLVFCGDRSRCNLVSAQAGVSNILFTSEILAPKVVAQLITCAGDQYNCYGTVTGMVKMMDVQEKSGATSTEPGIETTSVSISRVEPTRE